MRTKRESSPIEDGIWDLEKLEEATIKPAQWGAVGSKSFKALTPTHQALPPGAYQVTKDNNDGQPVYIKRKLATDTLMRFRGSTADQILDEISRFWTTGGLFKESGFLHRRGYLLYGPQGTGKSSIIQHICEDIIKRGGVVFFCSNPYLFTPGLTTFRQVEPDRQLVCIFEDIDAIIKRYGEDELLSILDGNNMVDKVLNIATTNYPEVLDRRIVSRPRRFDRVIKILAPDDAVRQRYLKAKLPRKANLREWFKATEGLSFAGLTEALISVNCLGNSLTDTVKILKDIENGHPSSDDFGKKIGFDTEEADETPDLRPDND